MDYPHVAYESNNRVAPTAITFGSIILGFVLILTRIDWLQYVGGALILGGLGVPIVLSSLDRQHQPSNQPVHGATPPSGSEPDVVAAFLESRSRDDRRERMRRHRSRVRVRAAMNQTLEGMGRSDLTPDDPDYEVVLARAIEAMLQDPIIAEDLARLFDEVGGLSSQEPRITTASNP